MTGICIFNEHMNSGNIKFENAQKHTIITIDYIIKNGGNKLYWDKEKDKINQLKRVE